MFHKLQNSRMKGIIFLSLSIFLLFSVGVNALHVYQLNDELIVIQQTKSKLEKEKEQLTTDVSHLSQDEYKIRYARENFIFKSDDETVVQLPK